MTGNETKSRILWRPTLVLSGVLLLAGGAMHPSDTESDNMKDRLAGMMSDDVWPLSHALILASTVLLAVGLYFAAASGSWGSVASRAAKIAAWAAGLYIIETVFHLFSFVDADELRADESAPLAYTHLVLATILYPVSGLAIVNLARRQFTRFSPAGRVFAVAGIAGGLFHALSVPVSVSLQSADTSVLFMLAGILLGVWTIASGVAGFAGQQGAAGYSRTSAAAISAMRSPS